MADDILGHENLDHGKHLKHHHKPEPGERFGRGARPRHIGLGKHKTRGHSHAHGHGHAHDHAHSHDHDHAHKHVHSHSHDASRFTEKIPLIAGAVVALVLAVALGRAFPALTAVLLILVVNAALEYHKYFTGSAPVDLEILYVGGAAVAAIFGFVPALFIALLGPVVADLSRGHLHDSTTIKVVAVLVAVLAGSILDPTGAELVFAILLGNAAQYGILFALGKTSGVLSLVRRLTTTGFNAYLAVFLVPYFL